MAITAGEMELEGVKGNEIVDEEAFQSSVEQRKQALASQGIEGGLSPEEINTAAGEEVISIQEPVVSGAQVAVGDEFDYDFYATQGPSEVDMFDFTVRGTGSKTVDGAYATVISEMREQSGEVELASEEFLPAIGEVESSDDINAMFRHEAAKWAKQFYSDYIDDMPPNEAAVVGAANAFSELEEAIAKDDTWTIASFALNEAETGIDKQEIAKLTASEYLRKYLEGRGNGEKFFDSAGDVLLGLVGFPTLRTAISDVTDDWWDAGEAWEGVVGAYNSMSAEEKIKAQPAILAEIDKRTGGDTSKTQELFMALTTGDDLGGALAFETGFLAVDLVTLGLLSKPVKTLKALGSKSRAAEMTAKSIGRPDVQDAIKETPASTAMNTSPFNWEPLAPEATDGIAADVVHFIEKERKKQASLLGRIAGDEALPVRSTLTDIEQEAVQREAIEQMTDPENVWAASDAKIVSTNETGFIVEYTATKGPKKGQSVTRRVAYTQNDVGELDTLEGVGPIASKILSPESTVNKLFSGIVDKATLIDFTEGRTLRILSESGKNAFKGLKKDEAKRVNDLLIHGDEIEKEFTLKELVSEGINVPNVGRVTLNQKEAASYLKTRQVFEQLRIMKNNQVRRELEFKGYKAVQARNEGKLQTSFARPVASVKGSRVYDGMKRQGTDTATAKALKDEGWEYVEFNTPIKVGDDYFDYGVFPAKKLRELPPTVLQGRKGYVPLVRKDSFYFAKTNKQIRKNGEKAAIPQTLRYFDNKTEAEAWVAQYNRDNPTSLAEVRFDRDLTQSELEEMATQQFGGLYGTARTDREILKGLKGEEAERISVLDAMDRNIAHISRALPANNFRLEMIQRWKNSASKYLSDPSDWNSSLDPSKINVGDKKAIALETSREWIRDQLRIPTDGEIKYAKAVQRIAEWSEGKGWIPDGLRKKVLEAGHTDPFAALRSAAFHPMLGFFNFSQLLVQAQNASIAMSLYPQLFPKVFPQFMALRAGMAARNSPEALRKIAKAMPGVNEDEFVELVREFDRTGLMQSLQSTADYNAHAMGYGVDAGAFSKISQSGLLFFREGELFGRGYAWLVSRHNYIKANKLQGKKLTQKQIDAITTDAVRHNLNLNRANRASWQKGALSVPTQFKQITAKYIEAMAPDVIGSGKFTKTEQVRIMLGQMLMYGAAGVPLGNYIADGYLGMTGQELGSVDPTEAAALGHGISGVLQEIAFGDVLQVSNRFAPADGINEAIKLLVNEEIPDASSLMGPAGTTVSRGWTAIKGMWGMYVAPEDVDLSHNDLVVAINDIAPIISTLGNATKAAMWWRLQAITDKRGLPTQELDPEDDKLIVIAKALGFQSAQEASTYDLLDYNKGRELRIKKAVDALVKIESQYLNSWNAPDEAANKNMAARRAIIKSSVGEDEWGEVVRKAKVARERDAMWNTNFRKSINNYLTSGRTQEGTSTLLTNPAFQEKE